MRNLFILFVCSIIFTSCSNSGRPAALDNKQTPATPLPAKSKLNEKGTAELLEVISSYYTLKDALVATSPAKTDIAAGNLTLSIDAFEGALQGDDANKQMLQPYIDTIIRQNKIIVAVTDPTCEKKRVPFGKISDVLFEMLKKVDLKNAAVYREYCPMAFNEKGAFWLSNETEIKNPYMGKKMLDCGDVEDSLK